MPAKSLKASFYNAAEKSVILTNFKLTIWGNNIGKISNFQSFCGRNPTPRLWADQGEIGQGLEERFPAKFHLDRCNAKPKKRPVSKNNTGRLALRASPTGNNNNNNNRRYWQLSQRLLNAKSHKKCFKPMKWRLFKRIISCREFEILICCAVK